MQQLVRNGLALAYTERGKGAPPLLLLHELGGDHADLAPQLAYFCRRHRVTAVDLRGHGESARPQQDYSLDSYADDLAWLCEELGIHRPLVVGHGLGGSIALVLAGHYPQLPGGIVLLDAPVGRAAQRRATPRPLPRQDLPGPQALGRLPVRDAGLRASLLARFRATPLDVLGSSWAQLWQADLEAAAVACRAPVLYVTARAPCSDSDYLRQRCPQLHTAGVAGVGHWLQLEAPAQINSLLERFMALHMDCFPA